MQMGLWCASAAGIFIEFRSPNGTLDKKALAQVQGVTVEIINFRAQAPRQSLADSVRLVFIVAAPFGVLACLLCFALNGRGAEMHYKVDAPVKDLSSRH